MFFLDKYRAERRSSKKSIRQKKKDYVIEKVCKPLERGNSKPFFRHLKQKAGQDSFVMNLVDPKTGALTDDPVGCAEILNSYFYSQFCQENKQMPEPEKCQDNKNIEVFIEGLVSLIKGLANGKSPGPD